jgi:hypothetical protein
LTLTSGYGAGPAPPVRGRGERADAGPEREHWQEQAEHEPAVGQAGGRAEDAAEHEPPAYQWKSWAGSCRALGQAGIGNGLLVNDDGDAQMVPPSVNLHDRTINGIAGAPGSTDSKMSLVGLCITAFARPTSWPR